MKKLAILMSVLTLGSLSSMAQGTIKFLNSSTFPILISPNADGSGATVIGTSAASTALGGGKAQVTISLYVSLASAPTTWFLAGTVLNANSTLSATQGTFNGGNPLTISANLDGGAFTTGTIVDFYYTGVGIAGTEGVETGQSAIGTGYSLGGGSVVPNATVGSSPGMVAGFTLTPVPEPTTIVLGGLGAAALLLYRRKK